MATRREPRVEEASVSIGEILGFHHVKVPVSDLAVSRAWYERVFDLEPNVEFRDNDDVVRGVACQPKNGFTLSLRQNSMLAQAMKGFDPLAVLVAGRADIDAWVERLDELRVDHSPVTEGALGWLIVFDDPDGIQLKLYTQDVHGFERPGRDYLGQR